jgi:hypothetical protein
MSDVVQLSADLSLALAANERPFVDPKFIRTRFSLLKLFSLSAAHYLAACQRDEDGDTLALRLGSGVHAIVLGQPVIRYPGRRAGKAWDAFEAEHADEVILSEREWSEAQSMATAIRLNREAMAILFENTIIEERIDWTFLGRGVRSTPDARATYHVAELKTARTSNPAWFVRDALRMHYHCQLAFYADAIGAVTGHVPESAYVVAVEKTPPYPVTILKLTERALEQGRMTVRLWFEHLLQCEASNYWPAYTESIVDFDVPDLDDGIELTIDGRSVEL